MLSFCVEQMVPENENQSLVAETFWPHFASIERMK